MIDRIAVVAIGRNEGERLRVCLESVRSLGLTAVYVDSGSTDGSVGLAASLGASVVELDPSAVFTAARGRREGFEELARQRPELDFVFFVDGDCEVDPDWPAAAVNFLDANPRVGVVAGHRRERFADASPYNRFADAEWEVPAGECAATGGDLVVRVEAYLQSGGWDPTALCGEEPELCKRIRESGWKVWRIDHPMTRHDMGMTRFGQWWRRQVRTGHGGMQVERRFRVGQFNKILRSAVVWGVAAPLLPPVVAVAATALGAPGVALATLTIGVACWLAQLLRVTLGFQRRGKPWGASFECAGLTMLAKPAIAWGGATLPL